MKNLAEQDDLEIEEMKDAKVLKKGSKKHDISLKDF